MNWTALLQVFIAMTTGFIMGVVYTVWVVKRVHQKELTRLKERIKQDQSDW